MLTKLAAFNAGAIFLDQLALIAVAFFLTPEIISVLGMAAFGVWQIVLRWTSYISLMDGRSHELLKWKISSDGASNDGTLRKDVGASLIVWLSYLPVMIVAGFLFLLWVDRQDYNFGSSQNTILIVALLMLGNAILAGIRTFPESILRGCNKGYKQVGVRTLILLVVGLLSMFAVKAGYGLIGLAITQLLGTVVLFISFLYVARKNVDWFGFARPDKPRVKYFYRAGFWYLAWSLVNFGFSFLDIIVLGFFVPPEHVSIFVVSCFAVHTITLAISTALSAVLPGMGALLKSGDSRRLLEVRREGIIYCWWLAISISVTIILVNRAFVGLWVSDETYAGSIENIFIVLMALQMVFVRNDGLIINILLDQKDKVKITLISLLLVLGLSVILVPRFDILGLCISFILGRFTVLYFYPRIIAKHFNAPVSGALVTLGGRKCLLSGLLIAVYFYLTPYVIIESWLELTVISALAFFISMLVLYVIGFTQENKAQLFSRVKIVKG